MGPHDDHFWHLFVQLKVDYLGYHRPTPTPTPTPTLTPTLPLTLTLTLTLPRSTTYASIATSPPRVLSSPAARHWLSVASPTRWAGGPEAVALILTLTLTLSPRPQPQP